MPFNIDAARKDGVTDRQIATFLLEKNNQTYDKSMGSYSEVANRLAPIIIGEKPKAIPPPRPAPPPTSQPSPGATTIRPPSVSDPQEVEDPLVRLGASLFRSPSFKLKYIEKKYGKGMGRIGDDGEVEVKDVKTGRFVPLDSPDPNMLDVIDVFPDILEAGSQLLVEGFGATPAGVVPRLALSALKSGGGQVVGRGLELLGQKALLGETEEPALGEEFAAGAVTQFAGDVIGGGLKKALKPVGTKTAVRSAKKAAKELGVTLNLADASQKKSLIGAQNALDSFPLFRKGEKVGAESVAQYNSAIRKQVLDDFGKPVERLEFGDFINRGIQDHVAAFKKKGGSLYDDVFSDKTVKEILPTKNISETAVKILKKLEKRPVPEGTGITSYLRRLAELEGSDLADMKEIRSGMLDATRDFKKAFGGKGKGYMAQLHRAANEDITEWGKAYSPEIVEKLREANKFWAKGMGVLNNPNVEKIVDRISAGRLAAEKGADLFAKNKPSQIRGIKNILSDSEWKEVQGFIANDLISMSAKINVPGETAGLIKPSALRGIVSDLKKTGALDEIFSKKQLDAISNWDKVASLLTNGEKAAIQQAKGNVPLKLFTTSALAGGAGFLAGSQNLALGVLGVGGLLGEALQNKHVVNWLAEGQLPELVTKAGKSAPGKFIKGTLRLNARMALMNIYRRLAGNGEEEKNVPDPQLGSL